MAAPRASALCRLPGFIARSGWFYWRRSVRPDGNCKRNWRWRLHGGDDDRRSAPQERNVISGNRSLGLNMFGGLALVTGNYIGTDARPRWAIDLYHRLWSRFATPQLFSIRAHKLPCRSGEFQ